MSINKAVFYLIMATAFTCGAMVYVARRMHDRPNRVQTVVELAYGLTKDQLVGQNMDDGMARKWFPFVATLFFFIWFSNMLGLHPAADQHRPEGRRLRCSSSRRSRSTPRRPTSRSRSH